LENSQSGKLRSANKLVFFFQMQMNYIEVRDLNLAATLLHFNQKLELLDRSEGQKGRVDFLFENTQEARDIERMYWTGELLVEPKKYAQMQRELKTRLYSQK
jgi:hypothetical protein